MFRAVRFPVPSSQCKRTIFFIPLTILLRYTLHTSRKPIVSKGVHGWCSRVCFEELEVQVLRTTSAHTSNFECTISAASRLPSKTVFFWHDTFTSNKENPCQMYASSLFFSTHRMVNICSAVITIHVLFEQGTRLSARHFPVTLRCDCIVITSTEMGLRALKESYDVISFTHPSIHNGSCRGRVYNSSHVVKRTNLQWRSIKEKTERLSKAERDRLPCTVKWE